MHTLIVYASYLVFPLLIVLTYLIWKLWGKNKVWLIGIVFVYLLSLLFIYARFIERHLILTQTTTIEADFETDLIVVADFHLGLYKDEDFLTRVVQKINAHKDIDAVLIPGDFTYYPHQDLNELFAPLAKIKFPVFAVLGNHDSEEPGPYLRDELEVALKKANVNFLHNESALIPGTEITILGLGDNWAKEDQIELIDSFSRSDHLIVMTHNPDSTLDYHNSIPDLTVSGHTHGGQIRIPWLYKKAIPCVGDFDHGFYNTPTGALFVTSGMGEVGLPMRLGIPPVVDVLELR